MRAGPKRAALRAALPETRAAAHLACCVCPFAPRSGTQGVNVTALREIKLLMELKHPNIIRLIDVFPHKRNLNLVRSCRSPRLARRARCDCVAEAAVGMLQVFEFMESDLEAVIKDRRLHLGPGDIKSYLRMVLLALECCHANWVLHRDMKVRR